MTIPPATHSRRFERADTREVAALKHLKAAQPELGAAVDMQIELVTLYRRVQARISTPWLEIDQAAVAGKLQSGQPIIRFDDIPFDWSELRSLVRHIVDLLKRFELLEATDYDALQTMVRGGRPRPQDVAAWYDERARRTHTVSVDATLPDALAHVLPLAARPFLTRAVDVVLQQVDLSQWFRPYCPFCGGEPELAVLPVDGDRRLLCGRCAGHWPFDDHTCPHCDSRDSSRRTSFASRDGRYRLTGCDVCRRYVKAYVGRGADRPVMLDVDAIATLPLDAVAAQRGYTA